MGVSAWVTNFLNNCRKIQKRGSLKSSEIQCQKKFCIKCKQRKVEHSEKFEETRKQLNLLLNCESICKCRGKTLCVYPICLPSSSALSEKIILLAQRKNLYGGVASTMAEVGSFFWKPVLRKSSKFVIQNYHGCKRFRATHYPNPKPGFLPRYRAEQTLPFRILGTNYAGPLYCKSKGSYLIIFL